MRPFLTLACALFLAAPALADNLPPEKVAEVRHNQNKAEKEIEAKYGNKKPKDMSRDEFAAMQAEKSKARQEVLDKSGVDPKDFDRSSMKQNRADRAATEQKIKDLEKKDADAAAAKAKADAEKKAAGGDGSNIPIQRGFNEDHPVELENKGGPGGDVQVEKGIPEDVQRDIDEARLQGNESGGGGAPGTEKKDDGKAKKKK